MIDSIRGVAFLLMLLHHVFYFPTRGKMVPRIVEYAGIVARNTFIFFVGVSLIMGRGKRGWRKRRLKRGVIIALHACVISVISSFCYPDKAIKFGVLHFIACAYVLSLVFADLPRFLLIAVALVFPVLIPRTGYASVDLVTGTNPGPDPMLDYFPIRSWFPFVLLGMALPTTIWSKDPSAHIPLLQLLGRHSLQLYTFHVVLLCLMYRCSTDF